MIDQPHCYLILLVDWYVMTHLGSRFRFDLEGTKEKGRVMLQSLSLAK